MTIYINPEKENTTSKKICRKCSKMTEHKYIETYVKVIQYYRPHSGRRLLAPREAKEIQECWKCLKCGIETTGFNYHMTYKERKYTKREKENI